MSMDCLLTIKYLIVMVLDRYNNRRTFPKATIPPAKPWNPTPEMLTY